MLAPGSALPPTNRIKFLLSQAKMTFCSNAENKRDRDYGDNYRKQQFENLGPA